MSDYQEHRIPTQSIHLRVREYPQEAGAVLFLHFGGGNRMIWRRVIPVFSGELAK